MFYIYDPETKLYSHSTEGQKDPIGGGNLTPPFSTTTEPIQHGEDEATIYKDGTWLVVPDFSNVDVYSKQDASIVFKKIGDTLLLEETLLIPTQEFPKWEETLSIWINDDLKVKDKNRLEAKAARDTSLNAMTHTLADGAVVQTRPSDLTNFQIAINIGLAKDWVLADNIVRTLTVAEMQACLNSGIAQADAIWTTYTNFLKVN